MLVKLSDKRWFNTDGIMDVTDVVSMNGYTKTLWVSNEKGVSVSFQGEERDALLKWLEANSEPAKPALTWRETPQRIRLTKDKAWMVNGVSFERKAGDEFDVVPPPLAIAETDPRRFVDISSWRLSVYADEFEYVTEAPAQGVTVVLSEDGLDGLRHINSLNRNWRSRNSGHSLIEFLTDFTDSSDLEETFAQVASILPKAEPDATHR